jgi:hypothetical protein
MPLDVVSPSRILEMGHAYRACRALLSAVELGVFTVLAEGPLDRDTLAQRASIDRRGAAISWTLSLPSACLCDLMTGATPIPE